MTIKGIGQELAERIIEARPFNTIDDLKRVNGIGPKFLDNIRAELLIESQPEVISEIKNKDVAQKELTKEDNENYSSSSQGNDEGEGTTEKGSEAWTEEMMESTFRDEISENKENGSDDLILEEPEDKKDEPFLVGEKLVAHSTLDEEEKAKVHIHNLTKRTTPVTRIQAFWISVSVSFFVLMLSLFLTLGILAGLNSGQLQYSLPSQYNSLDIRVRSLESQIANLGQELEGMRVRVDNLETLGNRIEVVEEDTANLKTDLETAINTIEALGAEVAEVRTEMDETKEQINHFQLFFDGLQNLLSELFSEEASE